jgi:translation initiation factor 4E
MVIPENSCLNDNYIFRYPLQNRWTLWAHLPHDTDWSLASYKKIFTFQSLEEIIAVYDILPESLVTNCMLFLMKDGITPMWEDKQNRNGGCFSYKISNKHVPDLWRQLSYVVMGESISTNLSFVAKVTGITISPKKNFCIVKIWMGDCENQNPAIVTSDVENLVFQGCLFKKHTPEF